MSRLEWSTVITWLILRSLCSSTSEPHIWMMVLYYSSFVVNICRLRVAVATVTLTLNLVSVPLAHVGFSSFKFDIFVSIF